MTAHWIYLFRLKGGTVHEGVFLFEHRGILIFRPTAFLHEPCPRAISTDQIEWARAVCENGPMLTLYDYNLKLAGLPKEP